jgi:hypothetical protein
MFVVTLLFFLLGATVPVIAQEQPQEEAKPEHKEKAKPAPHQEEAKPAPHSEAAPRQEGKPEARPQAQRPAARQEEARPAARQPEARPEGRQEEMKPATRPDEARPATRQNEPAHQMQGGRPRPTEEQRQVQHTTWQAHRAQHWQSEHRTWQQRGGYHGYRIPQARYQENFGPSHVFAIYTVPVEVYGGFPRFQYGGFWFAVVDPWPEYWAADWYDSDDVYVVYTDDGYYLVDQRYPGVMLALNVSM